MVQVLGVDDGTAALLIRITVSFICLNRLAFTMPWVSGVSGVSRSEVDSEQSVQVHVGQVEILFQVLAPEVS